MGAIDVAILGAFIIYAVWSGWSSKKEASKNLEEYFLAGRSLKGWQAGLSMTATQFASDTPLLITGLVATLGIFSLWQMWIYGLAFLLLGFVLAPSWRKASVITDAELTEIRYGHKPAAFLRGVKAIYFGTIFNCTVLAWVFFAATKIAEPFLLWHDWLPPGVFTPIVTLVETIGIPMTLTANVDDANVWVQSASNFISVMAIVAVTFLYSTTGGLRAVVKTDILQLFIMLAATLFFAIYVVDAAGGLDTMSARVREMFASGGTITGDQVLAFTPDLAFNASLPVIAVFALQWIIQMNSDGTGYLAQRSMACRSDRDARHAAVVFTFMQILVRSLLWLPIAVGLLVVFPPDFSLSESLFRATREATYVRGISELLPVGIKGVMLTAMLAALASTVDTHLNWGSGYWTNDIFKRFVFRHWLKKEPSQRTLVWVARGSNLLILSIALAIGTRLNNIQEAWRISLLLGAGVGLVLVLRWLWWRMNAWGEIVAILVSGVLAFSLIHFEIGGEFLRLLIVALGSTLAAIAAVFIMGPEDRGKLIEFYERARPPGFWGPIAEAAGDSRGQSQRRLWRGLAATAFASLTVFCLLTGIGSWLVNSPVPSWAGGRFIWSVSLVVIGLFLIPVWWRLGFPSAKEDAVLAGESPKAGYKYKKVH